MRTLPLWERLGDNGREASRALAYTTLIVVVMCAISYATFGCAKATAAREAARAKEAALTVDSELIKTPEGLRAELDRIKAEVEARKAIAAANRELAKDGAADAANADFIKNVKGWTWWGQLTLGIIAVVCLVVSFIPWLAWTKLDKRDALYALGAVAGLSVVRYILVRYGVIFGDIVAWAAIATTLIGGAVVLYPIIAGQIRRITANKAAPSPEPKG